MGPSEQSAPVPKMSSDRKQANPEDTACNHLGSVLSIHIQAPSPQSPQKPFHPRRAWSLKEKTRTSASPSLETLHEHDHKQEPETSVSRAGQQLVPELSRNSTSRRRLQKQPPSSAAENDAPVLAIPERTLLDSSLISGAGRARSYPSSLLSHHDRFSLNNDHLCNSFCRSRDPWNLPSLSRDTPALQRSASLNPSRRPSLTFKRISSLDHLISYREDRQSWLNDTGLPERQSLAPTERELQPASHNTSNDERAETPNSPVSPCTTSPTDGTLSQQRSKFRHSIAEIGFCFTIAMTQFLAEYLISGFAIILPNLFPSSNGTDPSSTGLFWPAALLSLILSAFLLVFARVSDMYGGYAPFMFGLIWLAVWTLVPAVVNTSGLLLDVSRAMQGFAIAAFSPSTFAMVGSIYPEGSRRNTVLGLYGACAPLGFFAGFLAGGALPRGEERWYFGIAAGLATVTAITAYLSVPSDRTDRKKLGLEMDWAGAGAITSGLILVTYALSVQPYANALEPDRNGFTFRIVYAPLASGLACLLLAFWIEGWYAKCPLLPFEFFKPRGVKSLSIACLFFYGAFGVWLYNSAEYFVAPSVTPNPIEGIVLSLWYTPMAIGGLILCVVTGAVIHLLPIRLFLIISGLAWVGAPLIFAVAPTPLNYWSEVMPSMVCGTLGIDLTFTVTMVYLLSSQPLRYQGVAGAMSSILINLGMSFSLPISLIVKEAAVHTPHDDIIDETPNPLIWSFRAAFFYGAASAAIGLIICLFAVGIKTSSDSQQKQLEDEEVSRGPSCKEAMLPLDDMRQPEVVSRS